VQSSCRAVVLYLGEIFAANQQLSMASQLAAPFPTLGAPNHTTIFSSPRLKEASTLLAAGLAYYAAPVVTVPH
jgi:hypothetical protein